MSTPVLCYDSYGFLTIILYPYLHTFKTVFRLAAWVVMHIIKFPLKRLMKKTHLVQLAAPLFTSCNVLIYYHIILPALLFIRLCAHLTALITKQTQSQVMWCNAPTQPSFKLVILLISVVYPACINLSLISMPNCFRHPILPEIQKCLRMTVDRAGPHSFHCKRAPFCAVKIFQMTGCTSCVSLHGL